VRTRSACSSSNMSQSKSRRVKGNTPKEVPTASPAAIKALGVAPKGVTTSQQVAIGTSTAPAIGVPQEERAIGEAKVETAFLSQIQPDVGPIQKAMDKVATKEGEKATQEAAAQAALQHAGVLMAQAAQKDVEVKAAQKEAASEMHTSQLGLASSASDIKKEREAMAAKDKVGAEIEARGAAKAKAEEAAAAEAARIASREAAEADAMLKVAQAKRDQATLALKQLSEKQILAQEDAAAATQRAANLTARSEAHSREAKLAEQQAAKASAALTKLERTVAPGAVPVAAVAAVPAAVVAGGVIGKEAAKAPPIAKPAAPPACCVVPGVSTWTLMQTVVQSAAQPTDANFPYILHLRLLRADLGSLPPPTATGITGATQVTGGLPPQVLLRVRAGGVEARIDRLLDSRPGAVWNLEGSLPIADPNELVHVAILDPTGFDKAGLWGFNWDAARVLGSVFVKINKLVDGHQSRDNKFRMDGVGGVITALLHLEKWHGPGGAESSSHARTGTGISDLPRHGGYGGYGWKRTGTSNSWLLSRQTTMGSSGTGVAPVPVSGGALASGMPVGSDSSKVGLRT